MILIPADMLILTSMRPVAAAIGISMLFAARPVGKLISRLAHRAPRASLPPVDDSLNLVCGRCWDEDHGDCCCSEYCGHPDCAIWHDYDDDLAALLGGDQ